MTVTKITNLATAAAIPTTMAMSITPPATIPIMTTRTTTATNAIHSYFLIIY